LLVAVDSAGPKCCGNQSDHRSPGVKWGLSIVRSLTTYCLQILGGFRSYHKLVLAVAAGTPKIACKRSAHIHHAPGLGKRRFVPGRKQQEAALYLWISRSGTELFLTYIALIYMPLTVCRCCGCKMDADQVRQSPNPNICASCEQLLEDDSPTLMAEIARLSPEEDPADQLLDELDPTPAPKDHSVKRSSDS
jgi:hypothetical protein